MKPLLILGFLLLTCGAQAQVQYAELSRLERKAGTWTVQADYVDLLTTQAAVAKGAIRASDAKHFRAVLNNQNPQKRQFAVANNASVTLLTFPKLLPKAANLETLQAMLEGSEILPSEFEIGTLFAIQVRGKNLFSLEQVNTRALTGVYGQAALISKKSVFSRANIVLDFVNVYTTEREMKRDGKTLNDSPGGLRISNISTELRTFNFAPNGRVRLLKNAGEYSTHGLQQLEQGLNGQDFGWPFGWSTYFQVTLSDLSGEILEIKQGYMP